MNKKEAKERIEYLRKTVEYHAKRYYDDDKPEISDEDLERAYKEMKEVLEVYDFDTADSIFDIVSQHKVSPSSKEKYAKVKELMAAVDRDALLQLL